MQFGLLTSGGFRIVSDTLVLLQLSGRSGFILLSQKEQKYALCEITSYNV